jgi:DNA adenine methylase
MVKKKNSNKSVQRSFLKWVGGKNKSIQKILPLFPSSYNKYYEPFAGSCVVHLNEHHDPSFLSDLEKPLIDTVINVKECCDDVCEELEQLNNSESDYYLIREQFNDREGFSPRQAAQFIYLNKCGYNGLYRVNSKGRFNGPFGKRSGQPHKDYPIIKTCSELLLNATVSHSDYASAISQCSKGDFIYFDPPYYKIDDASYVGYNRNQFAYTNHEQLRDICTCLNSKGVLFALSNSNCEPIRTLFKDFEIRTISTITSVSAGGNRGTHAELFISNY